MTATERAAGYDHRLAICQLEVSLTQVVDRPVQGRHFFEAVIRENLDLGRPDRVRLLFPLRLTRATPTARVWLSDPRDYRRRPAGLSRVHPHRRRRSAGCQNDRKIARALGPEIIERAEVTHGRRFRIDTTVVETNGHYPADSSLLQDGVRVLARTMLCNPRPCAARAGAWSAAVVGLAAAFDARSKRATSARKGGLLHRARFKSSDLRDDKEWFYCRRTVAKPHLLT
jgi:hypothetical protein